MPFTLTTLDLTLPRDHLYKHHSRPTQCQRCWEEFKTEQEFARHQTSDERCPILRNQRIALGFDKEQEKQLRSKKRFDSIKTADDYWVHIYKILFPSDDKIPSPCKFHTFGHWYLRDMRACHCL